MFSAVVKNAYIYDGKQNYYRKVPREKTTTGKLVEELADITIDEASTT